MKKGGRILTYLVGANRAHIGDGFRTYCGLSVDDHCWVDVEARSVNCKTCLRVWRVRGGGAS